MSVKLNDNNIASIKLNENEIGKAYLNNEIVFNHDAPIWVVMTYYNIYVSKDGINYTSIGNAYHDIRYMTSVFILNNNWCYSRYPSGGDNSISLYSLEDLRDSTISRQSKNIGSTTGIMCAESDGDQCAVASGGNSSDKKIYYTLNGGQSWSSTSMFDQGSYYKYIGENRFWIINNKSSGAIDGSYYYWSSAHPNTYYRVTYYLPDNSIAGTGDNWCGDITYCNNGQVYVWVDNKGVYVGTYSKARTKINYSGTDLPLRDFTYVYGKVYAIAYSGRNVETSGDNPFSYTQDLWVSNDGITFTRIRNIFPQKVTHICKANGKLCVSGKLFAGIVNENNVYQGTTFDRDAPSGSSDATTTTFVRSNKFPKI